MLVEEEKACVVARALGAAWPARRVCAISIISTVVRARRIHEARILRHKSQLQPAITSTGPRWYPHRGDRLDRPPAPSHTDPSTAWPGHNRRRDGGG